MNKKNNIFKFMAMSKLIGVIVFLFTAIVTIYIMYEIHISQNYDVLPQLIISVFGFASIYTGFYLNMAKIEHIEEEKTKREKELALLTLNNNEEQVNLKIQQIEKLEERLNTLINESTQKLLN